MDFSISLPFRHEPLTAANNQAIQLSNEYWRLPVGQTLTALDTNAEGLSSAEAAHRLEAVGPNVLFQKARRRLCRAFREM